MSLYSVVRGLWWVGSEVVDAARQLLEFRPGQDDYRAHLADVLAEKEAGEEVAEPQSMCAGCGTCRWCIDNGVEPQSDTARLWRWVDDTNNGIPLNPVEDCGIGELTYTAPPEVACPRCGSLLQVDVKFYSTYSTASAAPGVSPVEAADKDPGAQPPTRAPGSQTSFTAEGLRKAIAQGLRNFAASLEGGSDICAPIYYSSDSIADYIMQHPDVSAAMASLGQDAASVHDRTMRQRHNEDREQ